MLFGLACLVLSPGCSCSCSRSEEGGGNERGAAPTAGALNLLLRGPDLVIEEPGDLLPVPNAEWGSFGGAGWLETDEPPHTADGALYVETNQPIASLRLPATGPGERKLTLSLWRTKSAPDTKGTALVRLNGVDLREIELTDSPAPHSIETPAILWHKGDNVLELEAPPAVERGPASVDGAPTTGPPRWDTLALARVTYGTPRRTSFDRGAKRITLPSGTGLRYRVEVPGGARLFLHGRSAGPGELTLELSRVDPRNEDALPAGEPLRFSADGAFERALVLPDPQDQLLSIELLWRSEGGADFELSGLWVEEPRTPARPPIVFLSIDTFAARHMSVYGYERRTTPQLEELARDAVVFERCVANAPWTMPSYLSVMTGLYPGSHQQVDLAQSPDAELDNYDYWQVAPSRWTLAEAMRSRGYQTAAAVDTLWLSPRFRVDQGFDLYDLSAAHFDFTNPYYGIEYFVDQFRGWLDGPRDPSGPFFAFVHALDAHGPYLPEEPYRDAFARDLPADRRPTPAGSMPMTYGAIPDWMARTMVPDLRAPIPSELPLEEIIERYDEAILKTDANLGRFFDLLRERGLYDEAVIVVTGDHGESFAHGLYSHGCLWEDIVHVPLIVKLPRQAHGGTRVATSVQLVDVYPTLLELAGANPRRPWLHGRSLLGLLADPALSPRPTYSEGGHIVQAMIEEGGLKLLELEPGVGAGGPQLLTHPRVPRAWLEENVPELTEVLTAELLEAIRRRPDFERKFQELQALVRGPYYELYDLKEDPGELHDLSQERPEDVERLKGLLQEEQARIEEARKDARPIRTQGFDPDEWKILRDLGYVGEDEPK